jgi:hypothetical protein
MHIIKKKLLVEHKIAILENIKMAKQYVNQGKLTNENLKALLLLDPTDTKKYIGWISKVWINNKPDVDDLGNAIQEYDTLSRKGKTKTKDIYQFKTFNDLQTELDSINQTGEDISVKELETDYDTIVDNSNLIIMSPHTHAASRKLGLSYFSFRKCDEGKDSSWCTTYKAPDHFNDYYYTHNVTFYYVRIKSKSLLDKLKKAFPSRWQALEVVALAVLSNNQIDGYDGLDKQMNSNDVKKFTEIIGIS